MLFIKRRWKMLLTTLVTVLNFFLGLFIISSTLGIVEQQKSSLEADIIRLDKIKQMQTLPSMVQNQTSIKDQYFRIDYIINQAVCKPMEIFNTSTTIASIQYLTSSKFNLLLSQNIDIISINPILKQVKKIRQNSIYKSKHKSFCDYVIQLYVGFDFPSHCDVTCQSREIQRLTSDTQPFGNPVDNSFTFITSSLDSDEPKVKFHIQQVRLYRSSKYYNKSVYIRSFYEDRYALALILDSNSDHASITMAKLDRSLFLIKDALDRNTCEHDCSTIHISFSLFSIQNVYLRHENGRIKLGKHSTSSLFEQDATFKLIMNKKGGEMVAMESINLPRSYIAVDSDSNTALILERPDQIPWTISDLDRKFLFKLSLNE